MTILNKKPYVFLAAVLFATACSPVVNTRIISHHQPLSDSHEVAVYEINDTLPVNSVVVGEVEIDGHVFVMDGDYDQVMALAVDEAKKAGGNILKVTTHRKPFFARQPVHYVAATILKTDSALADQTEKHKKLTDQFLESARYSAFRIAISGGYSKSFGDDNSVPYFLIDYYNQLKHNYHIDAEATWFVYRKLGLGVEFMQFKASNQTDDSFAYVLNGKTIYKTSDRITVNFFGINCTRRFMKPGNHHFFLASAALGYVTYRDDCILNTPYSITGHSIAIKASCGYDYLFSKNWAVGFTASLLWGSVNQYEWSDGNTTQTHHLGPANEISTGRMSVGAGLRYCF